MLRANGLGINRGRGRTTKTKKIIVFQPNGNTVEHLKTGTPRGEQKCPSYRGVRLIEVIFNRNPLLGHEEVSVLLRCPSYDSSSYSGFSMRSTPTFCRDILIKVSVLERCSSYGMSVLRGFTVCQGWCKIATPKIGLKCLINGGKNTMG